LLLLLFKTTTKQVLRFYWLKLFWKSFSAFSALVWPDADKSKTNKLKNVRVSLVLMDTYISELDAQTKVNVIS